MKTDPILEELRRIRDEHAKQFNYDIAAIAEDHRRFGAKLKKEGCRFVRSKAGRPRARRKAA